MDFEPPNRLCKHLASAPDDYHVWFTGKGTERYWVCAGCAEQYPDCDTEFVDASNYLVERCFDEASWDGICGTPEIRERDSSLKFLHKRVAIRNSVTEQWVDVQPNLNSVSDWFVLLNSGFLAVFKPRLGVLEPFDFDLNLGFEIDAETGICLSSDGAFCAVFQTSGRLGCVLDLRSGAVTARLDRGDYRPENSYFPIAFFDFQRRRCLSRLPIGTVSISWIHRVESC